MRDGIHRNFYIPTAELLFTVNINKAVFQDASMPSNIAFDNNRHNCVVNGTKSATDSLRFLQRSGEKNKKELMAISPFDRMQKGSKRVFVNRHWLRPVWVVLALMSLLGFIQRGFSHFQPSALFESVETSVLYNYESEPRSLRSFYVDRAVDHYPFTGLADISSKRSNTDIAFYWHIPRSGGTTFKHILGTCLHLTQSSRTSADYCDVESKKLHVCHTRLGAFVNADTSDDNGIQRAREMNLVGSGLVDIIISSRFLHAASLFDPEHNGRAITIIRDPLERAVSTFYYLKSADWERNHQKVYNEMTLMEYIQRDDTGTDWMVRWLTGKQSEPVLNEKDLKLAKEILKKKIFIIPLDEMAVGVDRLIQYMGWELNDEDRKCVKENVSRVSRHNKSVHPHIDIINSREYLALKSRNKLDFELYDYALELFREQWALVNRGPGGVEFPVDQKPTTLNATAI